MRLWDGSAVVPLVVGQPATERMEACLDSELGLAAAREGFEVRA